MLATPHAPNAVQSKAQKTQNGKDNIIIIIYSLYLLYQTKLNILQALKTLQVAAKYFRVFRSRYLMFSAYHTLVGGNSRKAISRLKKAILEATVTGSVFDLEWCTRHMKAWCGTTYDVEFSHLNYDDSDVYMFIFKKYWMLNVTVYYFKQTYIFYNNNINITHWTVINIWVLGTMTTEREKMRKKVVKIWRKWHCKTKNQLDQACCEISCTYMH